MTGKRNAPGANRGESKQFMGATATSILQPAPDEIPDDTPSLWEMNRRAQLIALEYWQSGYVRGLEEGRRQVLAETWGEPVPDERAGRELKRLALMPSWSDTLEARGQHEEAELYRAMLRDRGVIA